MILAANLLVLVPARAETADADVDPDEAPVTVVDASAKASISANLKARMQKVVLTRFVVASNASAARTAYSPQACATGGTGGQRNADAAKVAAVLDPKTLDAITDQLSKRLSKRKVAVSKTERLDQAPPNSVVITGCITRFEAGNTAKRMVGMHIGASRLDAHVRILQKTRAGARPVIEFDTAVTGGNLLPPLGPVGLAIRVATVNRHKLTDDAKKLANNVSHRFEDTFLPEE